MLEGVQRGDSLCGVQGNQLNQQVYGLSGHVLYSVIRIHLAELRETLFVLGDLSNARPVLFGRSSPELEDLENLVNFRVPNKQRSSLVHFVKDASHCPCVHSQGVLSLAQENFRRSVPKGFYLVSESSDGNGEGSG